MEVPAHTKRTPKLCSGNAWKSLTLCIQNSLANKLLGIEGKRKKKIAIA